MPDIKILDPHVADLIAAGEVVERPGSVVKELLENSIDAGARNITVEIRGGGMTYIRVTDDGIGMSPENAGIAFLRHATSKLRDERGLEAIGTLGFRGEALAAVSAVSRIELLTRKAGEQAGTRVYLEGGEIIDMTGAGCPEGTTMIVRDLFYNTPARLKFMKSDRAEGSNCTAAALRCAMGHPEASVRCIKDEREEFFTPGDGRIDSCVYSLLGREAAASMLACDTDDGAVRLRGYVSSPSAGRGNRAHQFFYVNGRYIKSATLQAALEQAYKNTLLTGRFPACVLYIDLSFADVDVNVHPTKMEVKFSDEKKVFDAVYYAARSALERETGGVEIKLSKSTQAAVEPKADFFKTMTAEQFRAAQPGRKGAAANIKNEPARAALHADFKPQSDSVQSPNTGILKQDTASYLIRKPAAGAAWPAPNIQRGGNPETVCDKGGHDIAEVSERPARVIGEAMETYIIVENGGALTLIDKHAAHERIIFDRLRENPEDIMSQSLLIPITFSPDGETAALINENGELITQLGFELEPFGQTDFIVRAVPADIDEAETVPALEEICEKLKKGSPDKARARDEVMHTIACKAAIKAGRGSDLKELERLASRVVSGEVKYCPHGRPVSVTLTKKELDKQFKRLV